MNKLLAGVLAIVSIVSMPALAQAPKPVRGTIEKVDGPVLSIKEKDGAVATVKLTDNAQVFGVTPAGIGDIKAGDYIGVGAMP